MNRLLNTFAFLARRLRPEAGPNPELPMNIIAQIAHGLVVVWHDVEAQIDADVAKVKAALPASALPNFDAAVSIIKQGASDTLGVADGSLASVAPDLTQGVDALIDAALVTLTNGAITPLLPIVNMGIDKVEDLLVAAVRAKILKAKAGLAQPTAA